MSMVKIMTILNISNRVYMLNLALPDPARKARAIYSKGRLRQTSFRMGAIVRSISALREEALILKAVTPHLRTTVWPRETNPY